MTEVNSVSHSKFRHSSSRTVSNASHASRLAAFKYTPSTLIDHSTPISVLLCSLLVKDSPADVTKYSPSTRTFSRKRRPRNVPSLPQVPTADTACRVRKNARVLSRLPSSELAILPFEHGYDSCHCSSRENDDPSTPVLSKSDGNRVDEHICSTVLSNSRDLHPSIHTHTSIAHDASSSGSNSNQVMNDSQRHPSRSVSIDRFPSRTTWDFGDPYHQSIELIAPEKPRFDLTILDPESANSSSHSSQVPLTLNSSPCNLLATLCLPLSVGDFFSFSHFNSMQSHAYSALFKSNLSVAISAPTGSGKTVLFELAVLKELVNSGETVRALLICPTRTLCSQIFTDWHHRFGSLKLSVGLLTSETPAADTVKAKNSNIVIATAEKLDAITRFFKSAFVDLDLLFIDEIDTVGSDRGGLVEVLVLRMKTRSPRARLVVLSATIGNTDSIAQWIGFGQKAKVLVYGPEYQPVHIEKIVWPCGRNTGPFKFENTLNSHLVQVMQTHYARKPTLVFCSTRKNCVNTAIYLLKNAPQLFRKPAAVRSVSDPVLANLMARGVAYHHAGMTGRDRAQVEIAFTRGRLLIICCTSTLAAGVNLPAYLVVIKGTMCWKNGASSEYTQSEIMQMAGRAGRPQFESTGKSVVMTSTKDAPRYVTRSLASTVLESRLESCLSEHLVAEVYLGTIKNISDAVTWFSFTFMYMRYLANPDHYQQVRKYLHSGFSDAIHAFITAHLAVLVTTTLISFESGSYSCTDFGNIMVRHSIQYNTMINMLELNSPLSMLDLVHSLSHADELSSVFAKQAEQAFLAKVAKLTTFEFRGKFTSATKICLHLYFELAKIDLHEIVGHSKAAADFSAESPIVVKQLHRLMKALLEIFKKKDHPMCLLQCQKLWRSMNNKCWEGTASELTQVPEINSDIAKKLVKSGASTIKAAQKLLDDKLRHATRDAYHSVRRSLDSFPRIDVTLAIENNKLLSQHHIKLTVSIKMLNLSLCRFWNNSPLVFTVVTCKLSQILDCRKVSASLFDENGHKTFQILAGTRMGLIESHVAAENFCSEPVVARLDTTYLIQSCLSDDTIVESLHSQMSSDFGSTEPSLGAPNALNSPRKGHQFSQNWGNKSTTKPRAVQNSQPISLLLPNSVDCNHACRDKYLCGLQCCKIRNLNGSERRVVCTADRTNSRNSVYTPTPSFIRRTNPEKLSRGIIKNCSTPRPILENSMYDSRLRFPCTPLNTLPPDVSAAPSTVSSTWRLVDIDTIQKNHLRFRGQGARFGQREEDIFDDGASPSTSLGACYDPLKY